MAKRVDFERLRTMEDVLRERIKIRYEIKQSQHALKKNYERVFELFTTDYWTTLLKAKTAALVEDVTARVATQIRKFTSGMDLFGELAGGLFNRFRGPEVQEEEILVQDNQGNLYYELDEELADQGMVIEKELIVQTPPAEPERSC
ncbi:MAG: hypothetical protein LUD68_02745 [Rikenellaceae bacterium]|nr:hypothetical protein [Rikenellaceae bacterium]